MEDNYIKVKAKSKEIGLSADMIIKAIEIQKFAKENKVEFYVLNGKLKMRELVKEFTKEDKEKIDQMFKGKNKSGNPFGDNSGFGDLFGSIFGKK